jgi:hypothetical protein
MLAASPVVRVILSPRFAWHLPVGRGKFKFWIWLRESLVLRYQVAVLQRRVETPRFLAW